MRLVVDIPEGTLRRVRSLIEAGQFSDLSVFMLAAIENQLALEATSLDSPDADAFRLAVSTVTRAVSPPSQAVELLGIRGSTAASVVAPPSRTSSATADEAGWIWGLLNRLLPLKTAARVMANLTYHEPVSLSQARKKASAIASRLGARLLEVDRAESRSRESKLSIGFPVRKPADKSLGRYADHFVGRLRTSGEVSGGLFDLGFAGVMSNTTSDPAVGLTDQGWAFASLPNPVVDEGASRRGLSSAESEAYLQHVIASVPRERDCLRVLVKAMLDEAKTGDQLDVAVRSRFGTTLGQAEATTLRAGAIGRLVDLGVVDQTRAPSGTQWGLAEAGRSLWDRLRVEN